jgi:hypothetical protein
MWEATLYKRGDLGKSAGRKASALSRRNAMLEAQGLTVKKLVNYFVLLLLLSALTFVSVIRMNLPRDIQTDVITGMSVFLSAGCIGVVFFQNWKVFAYQMLLALAGGTFTFYVMRLI